MALVRYLLLAVAVVAVGCSGGGRLVQKPSDESPSVQGSRPEAPGSNTGSEVPVENDIPSKPPTAPLTIEVDFDPGRAETYVLTNSTTTQTRGLTDGPLVTTESFLNARQEVTVRDKNLVRVRTYDAQGGVRGDSYEEKQADSLVKKLAASVEGSVLQGEYDKNGRGTNLFLLGDGVGLNPMGPQAGSQEVLVGFMGILLPGKAVKVGDTWKGTYDITASAQDLFANAGAMVENGEIPLVYELTDYNKDTNFVKLKITSKGKPTVKIPIGGGLAKIEMNVQSEGFALLRYNDGWLQELRMETTIVTEGFVATKQTVRTVTRRAS